VLVGSNNFAELYLLRLNASRTGFVLSGGLADLVADSATERDQVQFGSGFGAITDIQVGPDGGVYVTSISDQTIYRIVPEPSLAAMLPIGRFNGGGLSPPSAAARKESCASAFHLHRARESYPPVPDSRHRTLASRAAPEPG
jgi:hypothetical protein